MEIYREPKRADFICRRAIYNEPTYSRFHWHERIEICQIFSDGCSFYIDGEKVITNPGDIVVMGEYEIHRFMIDKGNSIIRICQFPTNTLMNSQTVAKPLKKHITSDEISVIPGLAKKINSIFDLMEQEGFVKSSQENPYMHNLSAALYFLLMRHFYAVETDANKKNDRKEFYKITEYINSHYTEDINVESLAKRLFMPRGKLSKIFSKYAETDINTYIDSLRINKANQMFEEGVNITNAAFESGFQSVRTFNNTYKKIMNMTPSEYIKKHL